MHQAAGGCLQTAHRQSSDGVRARLQIYVIPFLNEWDNILKQLLVGRFLILCPVRSRVFNADWQNIGIQRVSVRDHHVMSD